MDGHDVVNAGGRMQPVKPHLLFVIALLSGVVSPAHAANVSDFGLRINGANFRNGATGLYTIYVANAGPQASNAPITVNLDLPAGFTFLNGGGQDFGCAANGQAVTCTRTTPLSLGSASFFLQVDVCSNATRVDTLGSISYAGDDNLASNTTSRSISVRLGPCRSLPTATAPAAIATPPAFATVTPTRTATATPIAGAAATDVAVSLLRGGTFRAGGSGVYFLVISNQGQLATDVPLHARLELPTGLSFLNSEGAGWACADEHQRASCTFSGSLAARTTTSLLIRTRVSRNAPPTVISAAYVEYPNDTDLSDNASPRPTSIRR